MREIVVIGIGAGNPEHMTVEGIGALNAADVVLIPRKGAAKADLADLRREICGRFLRNPATRIVEFDMPVRDATGPYGEGVEAWHRAIGGCYRRLLEPEAGTVALLVWGDPSLYDSTLRIAARLRSGGMALHVTVVPGITSLQALTAAHAIPLNTLAAPVLVTTGRRLRAGGWPAGIDTLAVMLDGACAFTTLDPAGVTIWWGAYLGMAQQALAAGPLAEIGATIQARRAALRAEHGWIMDTYLLRRTAP